MHVLVERKLLLLAFALIGAVAAVVVTFIVPERHIAETTFTVNRVNREVSEDFQFDNYYAIQSAEFMSNTVTGMLAAPDTVNEIYEVANIGNTDDAFGRLKSIRARQKTSHLVSVKVYDDSRENAEKVVVAAGSVLKSKVEALEVTKENKPSFTISAGDVVFASTKVDPILAGMLGLVAGLFVGVAFAFAKEYLATEE